MDSEDRSLQKKRDKVTKKSARISSTTVLIGILLVGMIGGGVALTVDRSTGSEIKRPKQVERVKVTGPVDYTEARVDMKKIDKEIHDQGLATRKRDWERFDFETITVLEIRRPPRETRPKGAGAV